MSAVSQADLAPLTDAIITAVGRLVDDREVSREPSHYTLTSQFERVGLISADPPERAGKRKRVRAVLGWAIENDENAGRKLLGLIISEIRGCGGFRSNSPNYVGNDRIEDARAAFRAEGFHLSSDGLLAPLGFEGLSGPEVTDALRSYANRAARGAEDNPLVVGTGKDLLEAVAAHVLTQRYGGYSSQDDFPTLVGRAFAAVGLYSIERPQKDEPAQRRFERALFESACAVNKLRNKEGTGHGRPWLSSVSDAEARVAIRTMGSVAQFLLDRLEETS